MQHADTGYADAGYEDALACARDQGLNLPAIL